MNTSTVVLASRGKRLGGALLDGLFSLIVIIPIILASGVFDKIKQGQQVSMEQTVLFFFLNLVIFVIIHGYLLSKYGQTVGKKIVGTRIVDKVNGKVVPFGKIFALRFLPFLIIGQIPFIGGLFGLTDILFIFRTDKRCIHDLIAGTIVVDAKQILK